MSQKNRYGKLLSNIIPQTYIYSDVYQLYLKKNKQDRQISWIPVDAVMEALTVHKDSINEGMAFPLVVRTGFFMGDDG